MTPPTVGQVALRPRWLLMLVLALAMATGCAFLGQWQWDRSKREDSQQRAERVVHPLTEVATPQQSLSGEALLSRITAQGTVRQKPVQVQRRGTNEVVLVAPLEVQHPTGGRATLPVVVGVGPGASTLGGIQGKALSVVGLLKGSEVPTGHDLTDGAVLTSISGADLVKVWGAPIYAGYLQAEGVHEGTQPAQIGVGLSGLPLVQEEPEPSAGPRILNLSYALQWWVFAAFAVWLWFRMVRDAHRHEIEDLTQAAAREAAGANTEGRPHD